MVYRISAFNEFLICSSIAVILFTSACGDPAVSGAQVQAQPTCISPTAEANPYLTHPPSGAVKIYQDYMFGSISYDSARQTALTLLGENTANWSDYVNIAVDDNQMVRIVVTYIDPVLVQYIVLNQILTYSNNTDLTGFDTTLNATMQKLGKRNEMLFMVTITSPFYNAQAYNSNVLTVQIPIKQLALVSASGVQVIPTHVDPILNEKIDITHGSVSGLVGYPLAVIDQSQCVWVMDPWSNNLILDIPSATLSNVPFDRQFWDIPYRALVSQTENMPTPTFDPNYDWNRISRVATPPTPNWKPNLQFDDTNWRIYWEDMGRYLWNLVITESYH